jgi:hypothetical protein
MLKLEAKLALSFSHRRRRADAATARSHSAKTTKTGSRVRAAPTSHVYGSGQTPWFRHKNYNHAATSELTGIVSAMAEPSPSQSTTGCSCCRGYYSKCSHCCNSIRYTSFAIVCIDLFSQMLVAVRKAIALGAQQLHLLYRSACQPPLHLLLFLQPCRRRYCKSQTRA